MCLFALCIGEGLSLRHITLNSEPLHGGRKGPQILDRVVALSLATVVITPVQTGLLGVGTSKLESILSDWSRSTPLALMLALITRGHVSGANR